jgi:signal transduction histidine kinase
MMRRPRLPDWALSVRFRLAALYSAALFAVGAALLASLYVVISHTIDRPGDSEIVFIAQPLGGFENEAEFHRTLVLSNGPAQRTLEKQVNERTLVKLREFSFAGLGALALVSLGLGWLIAGRVLAPIDKIGAVAREIQVRNLSRRIALRGPDDELKRLADTFDDMLDRLEIAFSAQRKFVADASHELRNPLAIVQMNLDVALADPEPTGERLRERAAVLRRATDRMARLVDDLLALARAEARAASAAPVDLGAIAGEAQEEFAALAEARGVSVQAELHPADVVGDAEALRRAVANLLDNAVRAAPQGSVVRVAAGRDDGWGYIAVSDQGPGIAPDQQARVFDRFARVDDGRARSEGGSGLGLAIVRRIAEAHGGDVALESAPGRGATFTLRVPSGAG